MEIQTTQGFQKRYAKLIKRNKQLKAGISLAIKHIVSDPQNKRLRTHKVNIHGTLLFSSSVNGNIRIIWDIRNSTCILLTIGGHSGKNSVYK